MRAKPRDSTSTDHSFAAKADIIGIAEID